MAQAKKETTAKRTYTRKAKTEPEQLQIQTVTAVKFESNEDITPDLTPVVQPQLTMEYAQKLIEEALKKQREEFEKEKQELLAHQTVPQIIRVSSDVEQVHFLWQAPVADYNIVEFGEGGLYGKITGKCGSFMVPKNELSRVMTSGVRQFLDDRWLIVLSGLTDEERKRLNCAYKDGEILSEDAFSYMLDLGDKLKDIFPNLCKTHKEMVAQRFYEAYEQGDKRITEELVKALNDMSKTEDESGKKQRGMFAKIIEGMHKTQEL